MTNVFIPIDERYMDLCERAQEQCAEVLMAFERIDAPDDDTDPDLEPERLAGIRKDKDGRATLIFQSVDTPRQRTLVYVDAILALADLLRRERVLGDEQETTHV